MQLHRKKKVATLNKIVSFSPGFPLFLLHGGGTETRKSMQVLLNERCLLLLRKLTKTARNYRKTGSYFFEFNK